MMRKLALLFIGILQIGYLSYLHAQTKQTSIGTLGTNNAISGSVRTLNGVPITGVQLNPSGNFTAAQTDLWGNYYFTVPNGSSTTLRPTYKELDYTQSGLTALDMILIKRHILNIGLFTSPYQAIAADVNNDGKITNLDILLLLRVIINMDSSFPGNRRWAFVDSSYIFSNPTNPYNWKDSIRLSNVTSNKKGQNFIGIKLGDVNNSWQQNFSGISDDTLKVMAYNVLNYGDGCQGSLSKLNGYFKTIIGYTNPDILSLEKVDAFSPTATASSKNFAVSVRDSVLNDLFPDKYDFATPTNISSGGDMNLLFYNKQKIGYLSTQTIVSNVTDFNLHKLYYKDFFLSTTPDTTFLYVLQNHTESGNSSKVRDQQVAQEMQALRTKFAYFPNLIVLGDFNYRNTNETAYQAIINSSDTNTKMFDPPFSIDNKLTYPADFDNNTASYAPFLTTSTRSSASVPNSCGTSGGGKGWYDHFFLSPWLVKGKNFMQYIPNSYTTIGNDGNRLNVSINSKTPVVNQSVPSAISDALFQFSNKYPIMIKLKVTHNSYNISPIDP